MSKRTELADAIVALLNDEGNVFSVAFTAERKAAPLTLVELEGLKQVAVFVFIGDRKAERRQRKIFQHTYKPMVAIQRKLDGRDEQSKNQHVDELVQLRDEIEAVLADEDLAELSFVSFDGEQDAEPYSFDAMQGLNVFAAEIVLEYTD